ncbi:hypothetical protein BSR09_00710 [Stutzerimonas degradans]|nr:hypothetical protein BSR09_00710 [Stutzerimonas degradans]
MLIDNHAIAQGESRRAQLDLSAKIAAYEAQFGPVKTLPIRTDDKRVPYRISCPEKKQANRAKAAATRKAKAGQLPLRKRGTPQAKKNAALREVWS